MLFDKNNVTIKSIYDFVETSLSGGESVLIHSEKGQSRSSCVVVGYLMMKFGWTLYKCLEFINSRRPDLEIRASFF
jgi:protein-tyrosine phosphatase